PPGPRSVPATTRVTASATRPERARAIAGSVASWLKPGERHSQVRQLLRYLPSTTASSSCAARSAGCGRPQPCGRHLPHAEGWLLHHDLVPPIREAWPRAPRASGRQPLQHLGYRVSLEEVA